MLSSESDLSKLSLKALNRLGKTGKEIENKSKEDLN